MTLILPDQQKLFLIGEQIAERIDEVFEYFDVELNKTNSLYVGCCPIHHGDNQTAFNYYPNGNKARGFWTCRTHNCQDTFYSTPIGLVRALLSSQKGWEGGGPTVSFKNAVDWCLAFLDARLEEIEVNQTEVDTKRFTSMADIFKPLEKRNGLSREEIKGRLEIPAQYYIDRGYSKEILEKHDVGLCTAPGKPMSGRIVVPVYDNDIFIGCTGRSVYEKCPICKTYHPEGVCPKPELRWLYPKWKHSHDFDRENTLYNFSSALPHIRESLTAILVESPGNVWRLEEAGFNNAIGIFGSSLCDGQKRLLDSSGAMTLVVLTDPDEAGMNCAVKIYNMCRKLYDVKFPGFQWVDKKLEFAEHYMKDIGDMSVKEVQDLLGDFS